MCFNMRSLFVALLLLGIARLHDAADEGYLGYGPQFKATAGEVWPKPYWQDNKGRYYAVDPKNFVLLAVNKDCNILQEAIRRYTTIIQNIPLGYNRAPSTPTISTIKTLSVNLTRPCESLPHLDMDESYYVWGDGRVIANSIWGILRGLETLSQLLVPMPNALLRIPETEIYDQPRFKYRGLMLDTARHFISKSKILQIIEGMAYNKLNVFHWHLSDDSAFTFNSSVFPELSAKGAYGNQFTYSMKNVQEIVAFATLRGIRVIPEFDTPAHTASWGASHPELMTECFAEFKGQLGPFNPTKESTFNFLYRLFREIKGLFPDAYLHLGVDEVASGCWESNPQIQNYLTANNLDQGDLPYLYLERFSANISAMGWQQMVWQEAMIENSWMEWPAGTIAQIWFDYKETMATLTASGHKVIMSDGWYLDQLHTDSVWEDFYEVEPTEFTGTAKQKALVVGGEACLWTENTNEHSVLPTIFPGVSAVAERLWSVQTQRNEDEARLRLEEHNCRMLHRGIQATTANGFGLC